MTEEYDISTPGSFFALVVREPDIWKAADAKMKMEIARDWAEVGHPMPTAADIKRLSPAEQRAMTQLLKSLHMHSMANMESETASLKAEAATLSGSDGRKVLKEMDISRDGNGKMLNVKVYG